jgi:ABC-type oligopeptide transport system ATPase subunit
MNDTSDILLRVQGLRVGFSARGQWGKVRHLQFAVDGVDLSIRRGATLGLVGQSGSGKTTLARTILGLVTPTAGTVEFDGQVITSLSPGALRPLRRRMQIIFQDPSGSLDPRMTVQDAVAEPLAVHRLCSRRERQHVVYDLLERVGLCQSHLPRYPHELSGGQKQRIAIARALASGPDFIVCDEPTSALDISIQAQILNLLSDLQDEMGLTYLFISHNLAVVEHIADEVAVMHQGKIVEQGLTQTVCNQPTHPYTRALLSSVLTLPPGPGAAAPA